MPILIANWKNASSFAIKGRMEASGRAMDAQSHYLFRYISFRTEKNIEETLIKNTPESGNSLYHLSLVTVNFGRKRA